MRYSFTIILAIFAILLSGLAAVFMGSEYRNTIFGIPPVPNGQKLFDVKKLDQTKQITLTDSEGNQAKFAVAGDRWQATSPWNDRADTLYINTLFKFTMSLEVREVIASKDLDLKEFGLDDGHVRITMNNSKGQPVCDFLIGRQTAWHVPSADGKNTTPSIFIRFADKQRRNHIYVCTYDLPISSDNTGMKIHTLFQNQFARFRDHRPFYFSPKYLDSVRLQSAQGEVVVSRKDAKSGWQISKPLELRVDPEALGTLFSDLARLTALKVEDRANVTLPTGEENAAQTREIAIKFIDAPEETLLRVYPPIKEDDTFVLATVSDRPDAVFQLPLTATTAIPGTSSLSQLQTGVNDLRSKTITHLRGPELESIILRPEGTLPVMLKRTKQSVWRVLRLKGWEEANQNALINLMLAVTRDKVQKFVTDAATDLKPYGLDKPFLMVGFKCFADTGKPSTYLSFGRDTKTQTVYAHVVGKPHIWQISNETMGKIALNSWQWRTEHVWHLPKVDIASIRIQKNNHPEVTLHYNHFSAKWTAERDGNDATGSLNPNRANKFLSSLESLKTKSWIGPVHPQAMKALAKPDTTISVTIRRIDDQGQNLEPAVKTLKIKHTAGGMIHFAKVDTHPQTPDNGDESSYFLLTPDAIQKLHVNLFE